MRRLDVNLAGIATIGLLVAASAAIAESRLLGVRSDRPGVAIVSAVRGGVPLQVASQGGGVTVFRIDNPAGAVPCVNRIAFGATDGRNVTRDVNVCTDPGPITIAFGTPGLPPAPGVGQAVTIRTDDPNVTIEQVFLGGRPVAVTRLAGDAVALPLAPGPSGVACQLDLGLALSDGRRIARGVDVCATNFQVVVELIGGPGGVGSAPAPVMPQPIPPPPGTGGAQWLYADDGGTASLVYGVPNSDDIELTAVCAARSNTTTLSFGRSAPEVEPGVAVAVSLAAGGFAQSYTATGSEVSAMTGESHPEIELATGDPLWPALIKESFLTIQIGSSAPFGVSLSGSAVKAKQFLAFCNPPPVVVTFPGGGPVGGGPIGGGASIAGGDFFCEDGSSIRVAFDGTGNVVVVNQAGVPPVALYRDPAAFGGRYVGGRAELVGTGDGYTWQRPGGYPSTCRRQFR